MEEVAGQTRHRMKGVLAHASADYPLYGMTLARLEQRLSSVLEPPTLLTA
jgi:hypothetical protein